MDSLSSAVRLPDAAVPTGAASSDDVVDRVRRSVGEPKEVIVHGDGGVIDVTARRYSLQIPDPYSEADRCGYTDPVTPSRDFGSDLETRHDRGPRSALAMTHCLLF